MLLASWVDGQPDAGLPLGDRGLAYGDGLFESVCVRSGVMPLLEGHLKRLSRGCDVLKLPFDAARIERQARQFVQAQLDAGHSDITLKILLTRGSAGRGYRPLPEAVPRLILLAYLASVFPAANAQEGVVLFECTHRLGINPALAGIKHLNRLDQVLARAEWDDDARYAEGLLRDADGRVIEGTVSNLCLVKDGVLVTPRLHRCGVAGVMRDFLLARALTLGIAINERDVTRAEVDDADEVFVCNSHFGVWPVREIAGRRWEPGELTRRLQAEVANLWQR